MLDKFELIDHGDRTEIIADPEITKISWWDNFEDPSTYTGCTLTFYMADGSQIEQCGVSEFPKKVDLRKPVLMNEKEYHWKSEGWCRGWGFVLNEGPHPHLEWLKRTTPEERMEMAKRMRESSKSSAEFASIAKKLLDVNELPQGALARYERDINCDINCDSCRDSKKKGLQQ